MLTKPESLTRTVTGVGMKQLEQEWWLRNGADIGCQGVARGRTVSGNTAGCKECPGYCKDAVASWLGEKGLLAEAKVVGIMYGPKPSGARGVIMNMAAPAGLSAIDGADADEFSATMSSTAKWLAVPNTAGRGCLMTKADCSMHTKTPM